MEDLKNSFKGIVGQASAKLSICDWYYASEQQPLLIYGPSGYGKTAFAEALGARTIDTTQFRGDRPSTILRPIKEADDGDILFLDEIHSLQAKVLEGLYKIIDKGTFYDTELCIDLPIPKVRFIFATNILAPLPDAFKNRCRFVELEKYSEIDLIDIVNKRYPELDKTVLKPIVVASKGTPRTALSLAQSIISGCKTEKIKISEISSSEVNRILESRMSIDSQTGLNKKEFLIIQKTVQRGRLSTTAVANILGCTPQDAKLLYLEPLRANEWLAINSQGVIPRSKGPYEL